jgi:hypothetical protein
MNANERQVGGDHYKGRAVQPWDYITANGIPYLEGCAIKYLTRWRDKGGLADLEKAAHFIQKLIEVETAKQAAPNPREPNLQSYTREEIIQIERIGAGHLCPHGYAVREHCPICSSPCPLQEQGRDHG